MGLMFWYRIQYCNTWDCVTPVGPVSSPVLLTTYHDDPSRLLCSAHAHYGRHANGGPLEVHPAAGERERRRGITESPFSAKIPPYYFHSCISANLKQRSHFKCVSSRHLQVWNDEKHRLVMPTCWTDNKSIPAMRRIHLITILWVLQQDPSFLSFFPDWSWE